MDLLKFQASLDAHTQALLTHSATMEKFMAVAAGGAAAGGATGEAPAGRGRGRPTNAEKAAATAQAAQGAATAGTAAAGTQAAVAQGAANAQTAQITGAAVTASNGAITHMSLAKQLGDWAKANNRDKLVALLGEFGAAEYKDVRVDQLPLLKARIEGQAQTPTQPSDIASLLAV